MNVGGGALSLRCIRTCFLPCASPRSQNLEVVQPLT